ncbi:hypothetical protein RCL1_000214 [Eukaryota sp. TZLM3-RCL]
MTRVKTKSKKYIAHVRQQQHQPRRQRRRTAPPVRVQIEVHSPRQHVEFRRPPPSPSPEVIPPLNPEILCPIHLGVATVVLLH